MSNWITESIGKWGVKATQEAHRFMTPKSGDIVDFGEFEGTYPFTHGKYGRIWTIDPSANSWPPSMCCELGSAFLFENGNVDISGGPFSGFDKTDLKETYTKYPASYWNWGNNGSGGGMGVDYIVARPVFRLITLHGKTAEQYKNERSLK